MENDNALNGILWILGLLIGGLLYVCIISLTIRTGRILNIWLPALDKKLAEIRDHLAALRNLQPPGNG